MLRITDVGSNHTCAGYSRRDFLRVGALAMGGLALPQLFAAKAAASPVSKVVTGKSVVVLFLHGGPPHIETFDPKMSAPEGFRALTGEVETSIPGVTFGKAFPKLAKIAHKFVTVRSYGSNNSAHTYGEVMSAGNPLKATMGSLYARVAGTNHAKTGMPLNALVLPESTDPKLKLGNNFETGALPTLTSPGSLGPSYAAFNTAGGGNLHADMQIRTTPDRLADRRSLLSSLDRLRAVAERNGGALEGADRYQQQAFDVVTKGVASAFDLSNESPTTIERYDTSKLFDVRELNKWNDMRRASNQLGQQMLLARRMVEAGCGFVTVSDCGWDYHANSNSPKQMAGIWPMGGQVDHAVSAFIEDLESRGLSDKVLLVVTSEMGRTPRLNKDGGRDHYGKLTPLLLYGGGLKMGQVVGASTAKAEEAATEPYGPENLMATIMNVLFDVGEARLMTGIPREVAAAITDGRPIREVF
ncbi:MAG TPA: DUF1501 domain-containing protein [Humisphaera sp.]